MPDAARLDDSEESLPPNSRKECRTEPVLLPAADAWMRAKSGGDSTDSAEPALSPVVTQDGRFREDLDSDRTWTPPANFHPETVGRFCLLPEKPDESTSMPPPDCRSATDHSVQRVYPTRVRESRNPDQFPKNKRTKLQKIVLFPHFNDCPGVFDHSLPQSPANHFKAGSARTGKSFLSLPESLNSVGNLAPKPPHLGSDG